MQKTRMCRCIQRADQPIILTGYSALNKLLGREVYTSHMQLGGPKVRNALKCLSYMFSASGLAVLMSGNVLNPHASDHTCCFPGGAPGAENIT